MSNESSVHSHASHKIVSDSSSTRVLIGHVPYRNRGGEDLHVEVLRSIYGSLGWQSDLIPGIRNPQSYSTTDILGSLIGRKSEISLSDFDLIHIHNIYPVLGPRFLREALASGKPVFWTVHNHRFYCTNGLALYGSERCEVCKFKPSILRPVLRNCNSDWKKSAYYATSLARVRAEGLLQRITRFIAPSPYIAEEIAALGIPTSRISMLPNPVFDGDALVKRVERESENSRGLFVYAGRFSEEKGVRLFPKLAQALPEYDFELFGEGPQWAEIQLQARGLENLFLRGPAPHDEIIRSLKRATAGILPSICNEICPTFAIETLAAGKPVYLRESESTRWLRERFGAIGIPGGGTEGFVSQVRSHPPTALSDAIANRVRMTFSHDAYRTALATLIN